MAGKIGLLQTNLNYCARAQYLFIHTLAQERFGIGIAAEPYRVPPNHLCWAADADGSVAITWRFEVGSPPCTKIGDGRAHVAVEWGPLWVVACYIPPSVDRGRFGDILNEISILVQRKLPEPIIVAGDLNAKSASWGSRRPNWRGAVLDDWAAVLGLCIINRGTSSTLVRPQGESIVDLTWTSPSAADRIDGWRVMEQETLSDHLYIRMGVDIIQRGGAEPLPG